MAPVQSSCSVRAFGTTSTVASQLSTNGTVRTVQLVSAETARPQLLWHAERTRCRAAKLPLRHGYRDEEITVFARVQLHTYPCRP